VLKYQGQSEVRRGSRALVVSFDAMRAGSRL
jgi:hypothetical protein